MKIHSHHFNRVGGDVQNEGEMEIVHTTGYGFTTVWPCIGEVDKEDNAWQIFRTVNVQ